MPTVELPDGTQIEFPDGTPKETVNRVSAETWQKVQAGLQRKPDQFAGKSLSDLKSYYQQRQAGGGLPEELSGVADAYVNKEQEQGGFGLALDDTLRQVAKGAPIIGGSLDEMAAGMSSLMGGNYDEALDYQRARDRFVEKGAPVMSTGLQLAGGIGSALGGANALGLTGFGVNSSVPLAQRALTGIAVGAPVGAADAFARGEGGAESRAENSILGGLLGGITGGIAPVIGQGISSAYQNIRNFTNPAASFARLGISRPVGEELVDRLGPDEMGARGLARIRAAGPQGMVADAGPSAAGVTDAVIQKGGPGAGFAGEQITQRMQAGNQQLRRTLDQTFGPAVGVTTQRTAIREGSEAARDAAYRAAYASPIDYTTPQGAVIQQLWGRVRPAVRTAANNLLHDEGLPQIADDALPDVRQIDYVTRALNDVAESAEGRGALGGVTNQGRVASGLAQQLRDATRIAAPNYGVALDTAASPIRQSLAVRLGSRLLQSNFTRADLVEELQGMTPQERQSVVSGLRAQLDEMMSAVRGMASDPNVDARQINEMMKNLTSQTNREKIATVLGGGNASMRFFREAGQAFRSAQLRASVSTNSRTAARKEIMGGMDERFKPGPVGTAMQGDLPGAAKKSIQIATGATPRQQRLRNNEQWLELARALTGRRGRAAERFLRQLQAAANARAAASGRGRSLGVGAAGGVAGSSTTLTQGAVAPMDER